MTEQEYYTEFLKKKYPQYSNELCDTLASHAAVYNPELFEVMRGYALEMCKETLRNIGKDTIGATIYEEAHQNYIPQHLTTKI